MAKMASKDSMQGFKVFTFKFRETSTATHDVFYKHHSVREKVDGKPVDRTLFLINVPPYCTEDCLKRVFNTCGNVTSVFFHEKPTATLPPTDESVFFPQHPIVKGFKVAYIVFEKAMGLQKALKMDSTKPLILSTDDHPVLTGYKKWCADYNASIPNVVEMQADINQFMAKYDQEEAEKAKREKEGLDADDDGWVTVSKKGRNPGFARKESVANKIIAKEQVKRKKKELVNFYTFQIREGKMKHLVNLRQKFEEDKKRINLMKSSRRFKPF